MIRQPAAQSSPDRSLLERVGLHSRISGLSQWNLQQPSVLSCQTARFRLNNCLFLRQELGSRSGRHLNHMGYGKRPGIDGGLSRGNLETTRRGAAEMRVMSGVEIWVLSTEDLAPKPHCSARKQPLHSRQRQQMSSRFSALEAMACRAGSEILRRRPLQQLREHFLSGKPVRCFKSPN
jgi:DNA polymerase III psi subunit